MAESETAYLERRVNGGTLDQLKQFPRYFEIETINACNAHCPMCTISQWQRQPQVMKDGLFGKIAAELSLHADDIKRVHLYRDGEPLLDKKLADRTRILKQAGIKKVGISTNAELLTIPRAEQILLAGMDEIILSIDSLKRDVYDKIRVGLDFHTVLKNCISLFGLRDGLKSKCSIRVRMIRQESNKDEWPDFEKYWAPYLNRQDTVEYRNIHNWGNQLPDFKPISSDALDKPCLALFSLMTIFADGTVPLCNVDFNAKYPVGNINDSTIAELWQSKEQERRRKLHMHGLRAAIPPCHKCTVWSERAA